MYKVNNYSITPFQGVLFGITFFVLGNSLLNFNLDFITFVWCSLGWCVCLPSFLYIRKLVVPFKGFQFFLFVCYAILVLIMIVRGYLIDYQYQWFSFISAINFHLYSPTYILPYFLPLLLFVGIDRIELRSFVKLNYIFSILFFLFFSYKIKDIYDASLIAMRGVSFEENETLIATSINYFFLSTSFLLLCKDFISRKQWIINLINWFFATMTVAIAGRRGATLMLLLLGMSTLGMQMKSLNRQRRFIGFSIVIILSILFVFLYVYTENSIFAYLTERGTTDTRSDVDEALLKQMNFWELAFGKGLNGRYYMGGYFSDNMFHGWRYGSETGFFNLVLKGGYFFAFTYIIMLILPAFKGIFKSKNTLTKALGFFIVLSLIDLYPFGWLRFDLRFFIIWIGVVLCSSPVIRNMNNSEIKTQFF